MEETWNLIKKSHVTQTHRQRSIVLSWMILANSKTVLECPIEARKTVIMQIYISSLNLASYWIIWLQSFEEWVSCRKLEHFVNTFVVALSLSILVSTLYHALNLSLMTCCHAYRVWILELNVCSKLEHFTNTLYYAISLSIFVSALYNALSIT